MSGDYRERSVEVRHDIMNYCRAELADCDRIGAYASGMFDNWTGRGIESTADGLVVAILARSVNTFTCAVRNVRLGYAAQAAMLNRSLFEDMVDAHWIVTDPETAAARYADHHGHGLMLLADAVAAFPNLHPDIKFPDFDAEERERLDKLFGRFGERPWSLLNFHQRVGIIKDQWTTGDSREGLRFMQAVAHRENNLTLHVSAQSLGAVVEMDASGRPAFHVGPRHDMVRRAVFASYWTFMQTVTLVIDHLSFPMSQEDRERMFSPENFNAPDQTGGLFD